MGDRTSNSFKWWVLLIREGRSFWNVVTFIVCIRNIYSKVMADQYIED